MERRYLLHLFTAHKNPSPFDVNMAYDAGWDAVIPCTAVTLEEVTGLVQDAIFSRGPKGVRRTGIFLGGRDIHLALDMLEAARRAMVGPFTVSVLADPSGAFTTAAAMVAAAEHQLEQSHGASLSGQQVMVFGGTGPVGATAAVVAAKAGASVTVVSHESEEAARHVAQRCSERFGVQLDAREGGTDDQKAALLERADVVLATARAGVQVLSKAQLAGAPRLKVAADVNAVPPPGLEGVEVSANGAALEGSRSGAVGVGALAVGNIKYQVQQALLSRMRESEQAQDLHFDHAFEQARQIVA